MPNTFTLIASSTVGAGGAASIDFTSIPSTYTDLVLKISLRDNRAAVGNATKITFNTSGGTYSGRYIEGTGSAVSSGTDTNGIADQVSANATASTFNNGEIYIPNYAGSNQKSISSDSVNENNASNANSILYATLWNQTAAITSIKLEPVVSASFVQYSTAYLYGVKNA